MESRPSDPSFSEVVAGEWRWQEEGFVRTPSRWPDTNSGVGNGRKWEILETTTLELI